MEKFRINDKRAISVLAFVLCLATGFVMLFSPAFSVKAEEAAAEKASNFVFVCPNITHEYWAPVIDGMERADEKSDTHTEVVGENSYADWAQKLMENMSAVLDRDDKPDGILVRGVDGMKELIDRAADMGIPVVTVDTDVSGSKRAAYVGSDVSVIGKKAAQSVTAHIPEGSEIAMVMTSSDRGGSESELRDAFENIVGDYGMTVVDTAYLVTNDSENPEENAKKQQEDTVAAIKAMLQKPENRNVKAIFTTGAVNAAYAAQAKIELGLDDLFIVGQDDTEDNLDYVRSGVIHAVVAQRTDLMGYLSVMYLKKYIDTGSLPKKIFDTGVTLVTQDNIDTYKDLDLNIATEATAVKVGYYEEKNFQEVGDGDRKSGYAYDYYQTLAPFANWKYEYVYGTKDELLGKLSEGAVDVVAGVYKSASDDYEFIEMGLTDDIGVRCFAVGKNSELLPELQYAMDQVNAFFPTFTIDLYQKYYSQNSVHTTLTNRESQWLVERNILRFGYVSGLLPFSGRDAGGSPIGLAGELIRMLEEFTEIDIVPVCYDTVSDLEEALLGGYADVGFPTRRDTWIAESKGLQQSNAIVTDRMMIVYYGEYSAKITDRIAYSEVSLGMKEYLDLNYPSSELIPYNSLDEMLEAVRSGDENCCIGFSSILQRRISSFDDNDTFNISYLTTSEDLCFSTVRDNGILTVILNKMLSQINQENITGALMQYARVDKPEHEITFGEFFRQYAYIFLLVVAAVFVVLLVTFAYYRLRVQEHNRRQEEMQEALKKAVEEAESANKAKTNFLSSMSHDIRTPMNAIVGMTGIAKKHTDDADKLNDCLDKITLSGQHLLTLINDVLDISKIESGKFALSPINFSLRRVVDNLVNIARPMIKDKEQEFDIHIHDVDCETLYGDELRISQIFINILSNAIKYTPNGGKIVLDLHEERASEQTVRLTYIVKDNGIGMSTEYMEHMYDAFTRATDSRTNKIQGTGLGLAIVKQMVKLMNGTIKCESEPNKGTEFTIEIELPIGEGDNRNYSLPPIDILLVDDDEIFLAITEDVINEMGAKTETACGGKEAIELVKSRRESNRDYDVVIVDWKMPELSGVETVRAIRDIVGDTTSIILVSAYDWTDIEDDAKQSGADGFISKPLFKSYLAERIGSIIKADKSKKAVAESVYYDLEGLNVLVAEDNELNWEVISELLEMYGITAERAENGQVAVEMMQNAPDGKYSLILMDVQMPVMNGKQATELIRKSSRDYVKNIPVIAMTADAFAEDIVACLAAGMNAHVAKPVDMNKLCQTIRHLLFNRDEGDESQSVCGDGKTGSGLAH